MQNPFNRRNRAAASSCRFRPVLEALERRDAPAVSAVSINALGTATGNEGSAGPVSMSANGRYIVFISSATDLVPGQVDAPDTHDVFVRDMLTNEIALVSFRNVAGNLTAAGDDGSSQSLDAVISADGNYIVFQSTRSSADLVPGTNDDIASPDLFRVNNPLISAPTMELVSMQFDGINAAGVTSVVTSQQPVVSSDGRYIAYVSDQFASLMVDGAIGDVFGTMDVFWRDMNEPPATANRLVSVHTDGITAVSSVSFQPLISANGQIVVYASTGDASLIVPGVTSDGPFTFDIFWRDVDNGISQLVSVETDGTTPAGIDSSVGSTSPAMSSDGRYIAYTSNRDASFLVASMPADDLNNTLDVFRRDMVAGTTILVSRRTDGDAAGLMPSSSSYQPFISADGQSIGFVSTVFASDLRAGVIDMNSADDVFLYRALTDEMIVASVIPAGNATGNAASIVFARNGYVVNVLSQDANLIVFESLASDLAAGVTDTNGVFDVFVRSLATGHTLAVSTVPAMDHTGDDESTTGILALNGGRVAFAGFASNLVPNDTNFSSDVFSFLPSPLTVTINQAVGQPDPTSASPISFTVVFSSPVTNFATGDVTLSGTAGATTAIVTGTGTTYTVSVSGMTASGTVIATIPAGVANDSFGVPNQNSTSTDNTVTFNLAVPLTVTINQAVGQPDPTSASPISFTVVFSSPVTNFATGDVTLSGSAGATTALVTGTGTTYTVSVSGMTASGTVIATIPAGVATDAFGTPNQASTSTDNSVTFNLAMPLTVTINQASGQPNPTSASPISFTVVFSSPVSNFATGDVTLSGTAGATTAIVTGSGTTYTVLVSGMTSSGSVIATIPAGVATDGMGTPNQASTSTINNVAYVLDPAGLIYFAVGTDEGSLPHVKVFQVNSPVTEILSFFAYDPGYRGGVRVATGDVNNDGVPDIITGTGSGGASHIKVFDGSNANLLFSFFAFDPGWRNGVYVAAGDVNGDGHADIIVGADAGADPHVKVFSGADGSEIASFFAFDRSFRGGVRVAAGDFNLDGFADIVAGAGIGAGPHVKVIDVRNGVDLQSFFAFDPSFRGGVFVAAGDVNGDSVADLAVAAGGGVAWEWRWHTYYHIGCPDPITELVLSPVDLGGPPNVVVFNGVDASPISSFFAYDANFTSGVRIFMNDVTGDGIPDILTSGGNSGQQQQVKAFQALTGDEIAAFFAFDSSYGGGIFVG